MIPQLGISADTEYQSIIIALFSQNLTCYLGYCMGLIGTLCRLRCHQGGTVPNQCPAVTE